MRESVEKSGLEGKVVKAAGRIVLNVVAGVAIIATLIGYSLRDAPFDYRQTCQSVIRYTTSRTRDYGKRIVIIDYKYTYVPECRFYSNRVLKIVDEFDRSRGYGKVDRAYEGLIDENRPFDSDERLPFEISIHPQSRLFALAEQKYEEVNTAIAFMNSNRILDKVSIDVINYFRLPLLDTVREFNSISNDVSRDTGDIVAIMRDEIKKYFESIRPGEHKFRRY